VFISATRLNLILSALFVLAMGACGAGGGCGACSAVQPLPGGSLPAGQTIEGGAQIRVTARGLTAITEVAKPLLLSQIAAGICLPKGEFVGGVVTYCDETNQCPEEARGCLVKPQLNPDGLTLGQHPSDPKLLRAHLDARLPRFTLPLHILIGTCNVGVAVDHLVANLDVALGIDDGSGELGITANPITDFSIPDSGIRITSNDGFICDGIAGLVNLIKGLLNGTITNAIKGQLSPAVTTIINTLVPKPLGIAGMLDIGSLLGGVSPGTKSLLEARILPGGYARMQNGGLSLGVITGINSDRLPATRTGVDGQGRSLASEPALCVPPLATPNLGAAPASLPPTMRDSFRLDPAEEFDGVPADPADTDVAMGLSETMLDLAGHHLVTSGALCLGVGTSFVPQLNVGTIGLFVRSLGDLASEAGNDPLLLVTRPQRAVNFTIGDNTIASPALTIGLDHLEVDFYAFVYERYVRVFTLDLTLNVGVNLDLNQPDGEPATVRPMLVGIEPANVQIKVLNSDFVEESPAELEAVLPSVFSLITPLLGSLPEIAVPDFAGIRLESLSIHHVTTNQDDFLAIYGSLDPNSVLNPIGLSPVTSALTARRVPSTGRARLVSVTTPAIDRVRDALMHVEGGALPRVTFDVDRFDAAGRELEWSYRLDGGLWRPWRGEAAFVVEDRAFAWQGKYTIGLSSRVKGDHHTVSATTDIPVIIDSVAPRIVVDKAAWQDDRYEIPAFDVVSGRTLQYAFGAPGSTAPASAWTQGATIALTREVSETYADGDGQLAVFVKDEVGNTAVAQVAPFHGQAGSGGCTSCTTQSAPGAGGVLLIVVVGGLVLGRRRGGRRTLVAQAMHMLRGRGVRRVIVSGALWAGGALVMSLQPGCSCGSSKALDTACESAADCNAADCDPGAQPFCIDHMCVCSSDIVPGRIGPYSDVAVAPDGTIWVSAYAQSHGDLVVAKATAGRIPDEAWEWVDGVPEGPVTVPSAQIRRGIEAPGADVGMYTSIAVAPDGTPMVSYFDRDTASLKLAQKINGTWQIHVVDAGTGDEAKRVGMYTSLTLRSDDGRPGIAYLAHVMDDATGHAEVRFASAQAANPGAAADWQTWVVDRAPLPVIDPAMPAIYPLPDGLGLFVDSARLPNQAPVVAYYDRALGDLKVAKFNAPSGEFAAAKVLDGSNGLDAGWSPSIAIDAEGVVHVAYVGTTADDLKYLTDAANAVPEVVDDGYRVVGTTVDGLPRPEFHLVGDDAGLVLPPGGGDPLVVYQDATTQELLLAQKHMDGTWTHESIAGATDPWPGGYGFYAAAALGKGMLVMSTWVVNLPASDYADSGWVEVFTRPIAP
jgi:hypothetical protein